MESRPNPVAKNIAPMSALVARIWTKIDAAGPSKRVASQKLAPVTPLVRI